MTLHFLLVIIISVRGSLLPYRSDPTTAPFYHDPPRLDCTPEGIQLYVEPIGNFSGHIYAKGFFFTNLCHSSFVNSPTSSPILLNIPYRGDCNVRRHHTSNPPTVSYEVTVVVQRHPLLVTAGDRAYRLSCVYRQLDTHVSQHIDVNDLTTEAVLGDSKGLTCHYDVLAQTLQGLPLRFANVGDKVVHRWTCDTDSHGFLVHTCVVRNEAGEEYQLVDERGCVVDKELVPDLIYNDDLSLVHTNMKAFKFADQVMVHFSCHITLCRKAEQGCEGIAPPTCNQMELSPVPVEYKSITETTTADWQKVISESLQTLNQPMMGEPSSPAPPPSLPIRSSSSFTSSTFNTRSSSRVAVNSFPEISRNYQEATTLPFDSSKWAGNDIQKSSTEQQTSRLPTTQSRAPQVLGQFEKVNVPKDLGLEIVDASNIEKELELPTTWVDRGQGYQTRMLSSSLYGLPEDDPLPFPETANVYYGNRRPRSKEDKNQERFTVEVEAAEMAVFTTDSLVPRSPLEVPHRDPVVVAQRLSTLQTSILALALVSEVALLFVIVLQRHFYRKSLRRLKSKESMPDY